MSKLRILIILFLIVLIPMGILTKFYSGPMQQWINNSLGGLFYEIFWCFVFAFLFQKARAFNIAIIVFLVTCTLEFLQLWHPPFLEYLRSFFFGRTILGTSFNYMDFPYYAMGSLLGYFMLQFLKKHLSPERNSSF